MANHHITAEDYGQSQKLNHRKHNAVSASPTISKAQQVLDWKRIGANPAHSVPYRNVRGQAQLCSPRQYGDLPPPAASPPPEALWAALPRKRLSVAFCHAMLTHQLPGSWPEGFEMVPCTTTRLLDCRHLMVVSGELTVLSPQGK